MRRPLQGHQEGDPRSREAFQVRVQAEEGHGEEGGPEAVQEAQEVGRFHARARQREWLGRVHSQGAQGGNHHARFRAAQRRARPPWQRQAADDDAGDVALQAALGAQGEGGHSRGAVPGVPGVVRCASGGRARRGSRRGGEARRYSQNRGAEGAGGRGEEGGAGGSRGACQSGARSRRREEEGREGGGKGSGKEAQGGREGGSEGGGCACGSGQVESRGGREGEGARRCGEARGACGARLVLPQRRKCAHVDLQGNEVPSQLRERSVAGHGEWRDGRVVRYLPRRRRLHRRVGGGPLRGGERRVKAK